MNIPTRLSTFLQILLGFLSVFASWVIFPSFLISAVDTDTLFSHLQSLYWPDYVGLPIRWMICMVLVFMFVILLNLVRAVVYYSEASPNRIIEWRQMKRLFILSSVGYWIA